MTEKELVYLCRTECQKSVRDYLFSKHYEKLKWWIFRLMKGKFYSIPIAWYELDSIIYESFSLAINTYDLHQNNYSFIQALYTITKSKIFAYTTHYISKKQAILNNAYSYDNVEDTIKNKYGESGVDNFLHHEQFEKSLQLIKKFLEGQKPITKKIIEYKCDNNTNRVIAEKLNITPKKVANCYNTFVLKARKELLKNNMFDI